jgi:hypothetical protein
MIAALEWPGRSASSWREVVKALIADAGKRFLIRLKATAFAALEKINSAQKTS